MGPFQKYIVLFCVVLDRPGSSFRGYFHAKMRGTRRTAKSDRSKPAQTSRISGTRFRALVKYDLKRSRSPLLKTCLVAFVRVDGAAERRPKTCDHFRWPGSSRTTLGWAISYSWSEPRTPPPPLGGSIAHCPQRRVRAPTTHSALFPPTHTGLVGPGSRRRSLAPIAHRSSCFFAFCCCSIRILVRRPCVLHFNCLGRCGFHLNAIFL